MFSLVVMLPALGLVALLARLLMVGRRPSGIPPGPPTLPVLGNIHLMPDHDVHIQYQKWAQEYGPIYSLILGTKTLIVLSKPEVVKDLLDKRSAIYSDRQDHYLGQTILSGGQRLLMMRYGSTWRMLRKMIHNLLNVVKSENYVPYQDLENKQMLVHMLDEPDRFLDNIRRYTTSLTTQMTFGFRTTSLDDAKMHQLYDNVEAFTELVQGRSSAMLEVWPLLRRLPDFLSPDKKYAKELHKADHKLFMGHWLEVKHRLQQGSAVPCFCVDMAKVQEQEGFSDDLAAYTSGTVLEAGADTTSNTLYAFVQAMLLFPDVQRRVQQHIDDVVGEDRMPEMSDYAELPYVRCCMKECLRWMPTTPSGFPHAVTEEDTYRGYRIPKGAGILLNVYAIHMDPELYPEPRRYNPDRYKDDTMSLADSAVQQDASRRDHFLFGGGRRICQGMHVAERSLFLGMARLMWAFDVTPTKDEQGQDVLPDPDRYTQGFVCMPEPFKCVIKPRSAKKAQLVRQCWQEAESELDSETKQWRKTPVGMKMPQK